VTAGCAQVVVLAGGLGTRLGAAGRTCPKILQPVAGRPFVDIMLEPLVGRGYRRFVFCLGHLAERVVTYVTARWGCVDVSFHVDIEPAGTAGSLYAARELLDSTFLVVLGDTYLDIEYEAMFQRMRPDALGVMAVTNAVTEVPGNVEMAGDNLIRYDKSIGQRTAWVDTGALVLRRQSLDLVSAAPRPTDLGQLFQELIVRDALQAHTVGERFYDIGTSQRLRDFAAFLATDPARQ
jgi:NDP-sugar pyrophosphorylase family protein